MTGSLSSMTLHPLRFAGVSALAAVVLAAGPNPAVAQQADDWNSARTLELVERAIATRAAPRTDGALTSFKARANGHVYFYLDRKDTDERTLVKADQVALELYWRAPDLTKQRIVGRRDVDRLPNRMYYHIDHLTVVLDEFGDAIRMGEGDEVRAVPHPVAAGADSIYDYRITDSLTLRIPDGREPVRLLQVDVRPRRLDRPAIIGSVFIDRGTAEIVRMSFTFTPASYVDRRLDYIRVSLDNGLWDGRHWLPHEQRVEIRRQVPQLDFPAGGVIRGVFRIGDYDLNPQLPTTVFRGPRIVALPGATRRRHRFAEDIYAGLEGDAAVSEPDLSAVREQAESIVRGTYLSGLPRLRLHLPGASSAVRYNRAEGLFLGAGATYAIGGATTVDLDIGRAFAGNRWPIAAEIDYRPADALSIALGLHHRALRDLGPVPGAAGAVNTLHAALAGEDFLDPYFATGATLRIDRPLSRRWRGELSLSLERHHQATLAAASAPVDDADAFERPVRQIDGGRILTAEAVLARTGAPAHGRDWTAGLTVEAGRQDGQAYLRPIARAGLTARTTDGGADARVTVAGGAGLGDVPAQRLFLLGGRGTVPGFAYRRFVGDRFALVRTTASLRLIEPWARLRLLAAAGWTGLSDAAAPPGWSAGPTDGLRASVGVGLGLVHDIVRVYGVRGLDGGDWALVIAVDPALRDML